MAANRVGKTRIGRSRAKVDAGFAGLGVLVDTGDVEPTAILYKIGACLVEIERHARFDTLPAQIEHPVIIKGTGIFA